MPMTRWPIRRPRRSGTGGLQQGSRAQVAAVQSATVCTSRDINALHPKFKFQRKSQASLHHAGLSEVTSASLTLGAQAIWPAAGP